MVDALLLIVTFHAVLWSGVAVLTVLEAYHPDIERTPLSSRVMASAEPHQSTEDGGVRA